MKALKGKINLNDALFIFDRGYASMQLMKAITSEEINAYFLMRVRRKFNLQIDNAPQGSSIITLANELDVRIIKFILPSGEEETLMTNLYDLDESLFMELHFKRWPIEVKYDLVKNKLELPNFTGWSSNVIRQDFWISMLLANVAATAKMEADTIIRKERQDKGNKYEYQANVNTIIASLRSRFADAIFQENPRKRKREINIIIEEISKSVVPIRKDRHVLRKQSKRKVKYHHNKKSNV